jgi:hypothetical protein
MRRRAFVTLVGGAAASVPFAARAQQAEMPHAGWLEDAGVIKGQNVGIKCRWDSDKCEELPPADLDAPAGNDPPAVRRRPLSEAPTATIRIGLNLSGR